LFVYGTFSPNCIITPEEKKTWNEMGDANPLARIKLGIK
jgi:hypothetical protein